MVLQRIPDIGFKWFTIGEILDLFNSNKIYINNEYQRGNVWKPKHKVDLIISIQNSYSIGVLVVYINDKKQFEVLDGQQRLLAIKDYLNGNLDLSQYGIKAYADLDKGEKNLIDAYCVYYLKLKNFSEETIEEDVTQTFLRLQEGTPLVKAEIINAHRGKFKDAFVNLRKTHPFFSDMFDKRFRLRQLAAEILLLELEADFGKSSFPEINLPAFVEAITKYKNKISENKLKEVKANLDVLYASLNMSLSALKPREVIPFYLLVSYLRKKKADNSKLITELQIFFGDFLQKLNSFGFESIKPHGMTIEEFNGYFDYKVIARQATSEESIKGRFDFVLKKFNENVPVILKDKKRFHDEEQKRRLYFRQKSVCLVCNKKMIFKDSSSHHIVKHELGGVTDDLSKAVLLHIKCHEKLERDERLKKAVEKKLLALPKIV